MGLTIYIASAGSGKTFQLVRQYLEKVIKNTNDYKRILAITFTNKAAEEMKSRIISELLILSNAQQSDHRQHLIDTLQITDDLVQQRAEIVMQKILHDYSSFGVSTIDSYFQVLSKTLSRELKLPIHYTIELDIDNIADTITDRVLELSGKNKQLTEWLEELLIDNIDNNKGWNIKPDLKDMVKEIINRPIVSAFSNALTANDYQVYVRNLKNSKKPHADAILNKLNEIKSLVENNGYTAADFKGKSRGALAKLLKLLDDPTKISLFDFEKSIRSTIDNPDELIPTKAKQELVDFINTYIHPALLDFEKVFFANIIELLTINEILKLSYQAGVIEKLNESLKLYRDEYQTFLLSDTTKLLQDFSRDDDASFIYEKSGNTYHYLFIDEFQDTSDAQWKILKPMVINSLSQGKDSLIVGDAKQSIYRWRGGNMELILKGVKEDLKQFSESITETPLSTNYRSKNNVIYFNNELFKSSSNEIKSKLKDANVTLDKAYDDANMRQADQGEKTKGGYIEINFIDPKATQADKVIEEAEIVENDLEIKIKSENEKVEEPTSTSDENDQIPSGVFPKMLDIIEDAIKRNYQLSDIAILVRKNDDEVKVADYLLHETTIDFISGNSLKITANNKVRFIISCLRFLYDTKNEILEEELNYFAEKLQIADSSVERNANFLNNHQQTWVKVKFKPEIDKLKTLPVNICYWELLKLTGLDYFDLYLEKFHDVMMEYNSKEGGSIEYFLKWWVEKSKTKDWTVSLPTVNNAVRIITIHQSKGLEFPIVIMPFADWEITPKTNQTIWGETTASPYDATAASPLIFTKNLEQTHFSKSYFKEIDNSYVDNLNLLYVAFTRAKTELYVFSNLKSNVKRLGNLLLSSIRANTELSPLLNETETLVQLTIGEKENNTSTQKKNNNHVQFKTNKITQQSLINTASVLPSLSYKIKNADQLYGDYLHHLLSKMNKVEELDAVLFNTKIKFNIYDTIIIERLKKDALLALKLLDENNFNDSNYAIKNESSIYFEGETLRPDKVLMKDTKAIIIDFKTGSKADKHIKQVEKYCSVIEKMGFQEVKGYLLYTETNSLEAIN